MAGKLETGASRSFSICTTSGHPRHIELGQGSNPSLVSGTAATIKRRSPSRSLRGRRMAADLTTLCGGSLFSRRAAKLVSPVFGLSLALAACGGGGSTPPTSSILVSLTAPQAAPQSLPPSTPTPTPTPASTQSTASEWEIGPIIDGVSRSVGMPRGLEGMSFEFPQPDQATGHVHYITFRHGSLSGKSRITLRYRITAADGVRIVPKDYPAQASTLTLYFQRRGDNWGAQGAYQYYRWYASGQTVSPVVAGEYTVTVSLNDVWTPVLTGNSLDAPAAFASAKNDADRVGFVFGGGDGLGHGVYATGPARFTIVGFEIQ